LTWPGHFGGDIDHGGRHFLRQPCLRALGVVHAVLQRQHQRAGLEVRAHRRGGALGVGGFDAQQHQIGFAQRAESGVGRDRHLRAERAGFEPQPVAADGLDVRRPADQRHRMTGARQHAAVITADRAGAHHRNLHRC
jgi:hypothetical protein